MPPLIWKKCNYCGKLQVLKYVTKVIGVQNKHTQTKLYYLLY